MRRLKLLVICATAVCALLACASVASAQVPYPGYIFAEVTDETDKPVGRATAVVYNSSGEEVGSSFTNAEGKVRLLENRNGQERFIFRIIKRGYVTHEGVFELSGQYKNAGIKVKLISNSRPKPKANATTPQNLKRAAASAGPSPPTVSRRLRGAGSRASPARVLREHPT
jgi:hypothetical protein